jgi:hypothetical protein
MKQRRETAQHLIKSTTVSDVDQVVEEEEKVQLEGVEEADESLLKDTFQNTVTVKKRKAGGKGWFLTFCSLQR